jgi:hypothetical protein
MHRRESTLLVGRAGPALSVDILMLMPALAPATRKGARRGKVRHLPDHGVCAGNEAPLPS